MSGPQSSIDEACRRRFEAHRLDGGRSPLEDFLPAEDAPAYGPTLEELVAIDLEFRWRARRDEPDTNGEPPSVSEYVERFPALAADGVRERLGSVADWIRAEYTAVEPAAPGTRIGRYALKRRTGRGAFAEVWLARDEELGRDVAVKLLRPELAGDPTARKRLLREAQSAARLRHPSIVAVHEVVEHGDRPCIVSDFVHGPTLRQLSQKRSFTPDEAARVSAQLADALHFAHEHGVVHRDVKPGNVLVGENGRPVLTDFGLAWLHTGDVTLTRHGEILGTPAYMAPEQARGSTGDVDARSDVYSLGAVLYELLCGEAPFGGRSSTSVLYAVLHEEPEPLHARLQSVPRDLETICLTAMAKEPSRRYDTAEALADDLRRYLDRRPIRARPPGPVARAALWARRNPAIAATLAVSGVVVAAVVAAAFVRVVGERDVAVAERARADSNLYQSLVSEAEAHVEAKGTDWYVRALDSVRRAAALDVPERDPVALRTLVARCFGSTDPSFHLDTTWEAAEGPATRLVIDADGHRLAGVTRDGVLWVRHATRGDVLARERFDEAPPRRLAIHPSGRYLAAGSSDGRVRVLDAATLEPMQEPLHGDGAVAALAYSPDGHHLAVGRDGDDSIRVARIGLAGLATDVRSLPGHAGGTFCLAFSPDGERLASGGADSKVRMKQLEGGETRSFVVSHPPTRLAWSPSGDWIAWTCTERFSFDLIRPDHPEPQVLAKSGHDHAISALVWDRWERPWTAAPDGTLRAWDTALDEVARARDEGNVPMAAAMFPGTARAAAAHADGTVRFWELRSPGGIRQWSTDHAAAFVPGTETLVTSRGLVDHGGEELVVRPYAPAGVVSVALEPDGKHLGVRTADGHGWGWNPDSRPRPFLERENPFERPAMRAKATSADEGVTAAAGPWTAAVTGGPNVLLRHASQRSDSRTLHTGDRDLITVALSPGGERLAALDDAGNVTVWDPSSPEPSLLWTEAVAGRARWLGFAAGGQALVVGGGGADPVFDAATGRRVARLELLHGSTCGAALPDAGLLCVGFRTGTILAWADEDLLAGQQEGGAVPYVRPRRTVLPGGHTHTQWGIAASPDGRHFVTTSHLGRAVLWDARTGWFVGQFNEVGDMAWTAAFSPDSRTVAMAQSGDITLYRVDGSEIRRLEGHERLVVSLAFHPTRPLLASADNTSTVRTWDPDAGVETAQLSVGDERIRSLAWRPDGRVLAGAGGSGDVWLWDAAEAVSPTARRVRGPGSELWAVGYDADGRTLAAAAVDGAVALLDAETLEHVVTLRAHNRRARSVSFSDNGRWLAVGGFVTGCVTWDLRELRALLAPMGLDW